MVLDVEQCNKAIGPFVGLDFGEKTIGVSVSRNNVAIGVTTLTRDNPQALRQNLKDLKDILRNYGVRDIVLGYPMYLDGNQSPRCVATLEFKAKLERYFKSATVHLWDERLSTAAVTRTFSGKKEQYKTHVDEMAAIYILQGFLDAKLKEQL